MSDRADKVDVGSVPDGKPAGSFTRLEEKEMFLERDIERLREGGRVLTARMDDLEQRVAHLERRLDALLELHREGPVGGDVLEGED